MSVEHLLGEYERLRSELSQAYSEIEWDESRVDRIADEIAAVERQISCFAPISLRAPQASVPSTCGGS